MSDNPESPESSSWLLPAAGIAKCLQTLAEVAPLDAAECPSPVMVDTTAWIRWALAGLHVCALPHEGEDRQGPRVPTIRLMVKEARRVAVTLAMDRHVGNITHAAKALGTSRRALREHLKAAGLYPWGGVAEGDVHGEEDGEARTGHAEICTGDANVCTGDGKAHDGNGGAHVL